MQVETSQLDEMRDAAHALGMAFARAAQTEGDADRKLVLFDAFHRSFASVRLSIALALRLEREARASARAPIERPEIDLSEAEPLDAERAEAPERYDERDRDRETERASFPVLLRTLGQVADDAQALLPQAAELPSLRELLDRVGGPPATAAPVATPLRSRLSGGTATLTLPPPRLGPGRLPDGSPRRSTGPPHR